MPYPDPRELSVANVGSNLRPRAATRDLRASVRLQIVCLCHLRHVRCAAVVLDAATDAAPRTWDS